MSKPDWEGLRKLYEEGAADVEAARFLRVTERRFYQLVEESPAFAEFVEMGNTLSKAWWYEMTRKAVFMEKVQASILGLNMKNRHRWADKVDTNDTTNKEPTDLEEMKGQLAAAMKRIAKTNPELLNGANLTKIENAND